MKSSTRVNGESLFEAVSRAVARRVVGAAKLRFPSTPLQRVRESLVVLDTFDGRLARHGMELVHRSRGAERALELRLPARAGSEAERAADRVASIAGARAELARPADGIFAWDLPAGALRGAIEAVVDVRRLLPVLRVELRSVEIGLLDAREKVVGRLAATASRASAVDVGGHADEIRALPPMVRLVPLRGLAGQLAEVAAWLPEQNGVTRLAGGQLGLVRGLLEPSVWPPGKLDLELDRDAPAITAMQAILAHLLATALANEAGVRLDLDTEFLHDFRVALRRARTALRELGESLPRPDVAALRDELAWLAGRTGPVRDLDVHLQDLRSETGGEAFALVADLAPLRTLLGERRRAAHAELVAALRSRRYRALVRGWRRLARQGPVSEMTTGALAAGRLRKSLRGAIKRGKGLGADAEAAALHRLRISCKRLRYLLEFFRRLYPPPRVDPLISALKDLQDVLGELNDCAVQQHALADAAEALQAGRRPAVASIVAIGRLVERLAVRSAGARGRFADQFISFSATAEHAEHLFRRPGRGRAVDG